MNDSHSAVVLSAEKSNQTQAIRACVWLRLVAFGCFLMDLFFRACFGFRSVVVNVQHFDTLRFDLFDLFLVR